MNFIEISEELKKCGDEIEAAHIKTRKIIEENESKVKKIFNEAWKEKFPNHKCYNIPSVTVSGIRVYLYSIDNEYLFLEGGGWGKQDKEDDYGFGTIIEGPFDFKLLTDFINQFQIENPGIQIELSELKIKTEADLDGIRTIKDIKLLNKDKQVLLIEEGNKWHKGWDIPDRFIICKIDQDTYAFWSTDGHGGPLAHVAKENTPEYTSFLIWKIE